MVLIILYQVMMIQKQLIFIVIYKDTIVSAKKSINNVEPKKLTEKKDKNENDKKSKTVAEIDRDKLEKNFQKKNKLN